MKLPFGLTGPMGWLIAGLAALALVALIVGGVKACVQIQAEQDNQLVNAGVDKERAQTQGKVLNRVQDARNAVDNPTAADLQRVCDKYDRNCAPSD